MRDVFDYLLDVLGLALAGAVVAGSVVSAGVFAFYMTQAFLFRMAF